MKTWIRHFANVRPKIGMVEVIEQTYDGNNPHFKRKRIKTRIVAQIPLTIVIPMKEYENTKSHYDYTAFQSSDREWTTTHKYMAYDKEVIEKLKTEALKGFNTEPQEIKE